MRETYLTSGLKGLDALLGGRGLETQKIYEFYEVDEYIGRRTLRYQLMCTAFLPVAQGGLGGKSMYLSSTDEFDIRRLRQIAARFGIAPDEIGGPILADRIPRLDILLDLCEQSMEAEILQQGVRLIWLESIDDLLEYDHLPEHRAMMARIVQCIRQVIQKVDGVAVITNRIGDLDDCFDPCSPLVTQLQYLKRYDLGYKPDVVLRTWTRKSAKGYLTEFQLDDPAAPTPTECFAEVVETGLTDCAPPKTQQVAPALPNKVSPQRAMERNKAKALRKVKPIEPYIADSRYFQTALELERLTLAKTYIEVQDLIPKEAVLMYMPVTFESLRSFNRDDAVKELVDDNSLQNPLSEAIAREVANLVIGKKARIVKQKEFIFQGGQYIAVTFDAAPETIRPLIVRKVAPKTATSKINIPIRESYYKGALLDFLRTCEFPRIPSSQQVSAPAWLLEEMNSPDHPLDYYAASLFASDIREDEAREFTLQGVAYSIVPYLMRAGKCSILFLRTFTCRKCGEEITSYEWCLGGTCWTCKGTLHQLVQTRIQALKYLRTVNAFAELLKNYVPDDFPTAEQYGQLAEYLFEQNSLANPLSELLGFAVVYTRVSDQLVFELQDLVCEGARYRILGFGDVDDLKGILFLLDAVGVPPRVPPDASSRAQFETLLRQFTRLHHAFDANEAKRDFEEEEGEMDEQKAVLSELADKLQALNTLDTPIDEESAYQIARLQYSCYFRSKDFRSQGVDYRVLLHGSDDGIHGFLFIKLKGQGKEEKIREAMTEAKEKKEEKKEEMGEKKKAEIIMQNVFVIDLKKYLKAIPDQTLERLTEEFLNSNDFGGREMDTGMDIEDLDMDMDSLEEHEYSSMPQSLRAPELYPRYFQTILVGTVAQETERAVQIEVTASKVWVPKSVLLSKYDGEKPSPQLFIVKPKFMRRDIAKTLEVKVVRETEKAVMLANPRGTPLTDLYHTPIADTSEIWFPKSIILSAYQQTSGLWLILVPNWFVQKQAELKKVEERIAREPQTAAERVEYETAIAEIEGFIGLNGLVQTARKAPCKGAKEQIASAAVPDDHLKVEATWYADSQTLVIFRQQAADRGETLYFSKQKPIENGVE